MRRLHGWGLVFCVLLRADGHDPIHGSIPSLPGWLTVFEAQSPLSTPSELFLLYSTLQLYTGNSRRRPPGREERNTTFILQ